MITFHCIVLAAILFPGHPYIESATALSNNFTNLLVMGNFSFDHFYTLAGPPAKVVLDQVHVYIIYILYTRTAILGHPSWWALPAHAVCLCL